MAAPDDGLYTPPDGSLEEAVLMKAPGGGAEFLFKKLPEQPAKKKVADYFLKDHYIGSASVESFMGSVSEGKVHEFELEKADECVRAHHPENGRRVVLADTKAMALTDLAPARPSATVIDQAVDSVVAEALRHMDEGGALPPPLSKPPVKVVTVNRFGATPVLRPGLAQAGVEQLVYPCADIVRADKWSDVIQKWESWSDEKRKKAKQRVRKMGVTDCLRGKVWARFLEITARMGEGSYQMHLGQESGAEASIDSDMPLHASLHAYYFEEGGKGQCALKTLLNAFLVAHKDMAYQRSLSSAATLLLVHMTDEEAFYSLQGLASDPFGFTGELFLPGCPGARKLSYLFNVLLESTLPRVSQHFAKEKLWEPSYAVFWFQSFFVDALPFHFATRIFDVVVAEGARFLLRAGLALLKLMQGELLKATYDTLLVMLRAPIEHLTCTPEEVIKVASSLTISNNKFDKACKEYDGLR